MSAKIANFGKIFTISMLLIMMLSLVPIQAQPSVLQAYEKWGPRIDHILFKIYGTYEAEVAALQAGEVDIIDWPLDKDTYDTLLANPDFVLAPLTMYDAYDIDINNLRWPTSDVNFRRAIAYLVDYETFYTTVLRAYSGTLMDSIIFSEWEKWYNPNAKKYSYSKATAEAILDAAGFQDWDSDGTREYKNASGTFELPPLMFYAREDDPPRKSLGDMLNEELNAVGIPTDYTVAVYDICSVAAYETYEYHLYTAGMGPFNDPTFLYDYYHSQFGIGVYPEPWAMNSVFFTNATYDSWAEKLKYAPDEASAIEACKKCQEIFMEEVPIITVYHSAGSMPYKAKYGHWDGEEAYWDLPWEGIINSVNPSYTSGVNDWWTLLNAHPKNVSKGGILRYGTMGDASAMNPVMQYWYWDMMYLWPVYDPLLHWDPYNQTLVPWLAEKYKIETWDNEGQNATKLTFNLYKTVKWHDGENLTSADVAFTMKYMYDASSPLYYPYVESIHRIDEAEPHIETPDPYTVIIYFNVEYIWALQLTGLVPIIPKHVWESIPPEECEAQGEFVTAGNLTGTGPFVITNHVQDESWLFTANPNYFRRLAGDIDTSGKVDIVDIASVAKGFGQTVPVIVNGELKISPILDQNGDQKINIVDITIVAKNFGRTV